MDHITATIAYPAKLVVENKVVRDMLPGRGKWSFTEQNHGPSGATATGDQEPYSLKVSSHES